MTSCPDCHAQLSADARFCPVCGKAASATESDSRIPIGAIPPAEIVGHTIAGRYRILAKLGEGGMGAVYRGEQISLKRACAVKLLRPELSQNQALMRRFNAEAAVIAKLGHPNTVNIYDFGQDTDGSLFIAMEFIEGRSLRTALQLEGPFPPARALAIALQVAASLSDAHAHGIVHRDLKPDNVMLQERGRQRDVVRVLDFGIAKLRDDSRATQQAMTQAGDMLGTPQYMAPEQIRGEQIDGRTDVYALGCMLYEMVTARLPFEAPTIMAMLSKHLLEPPVPPSQRRPDLAIPPAIDQLVMLAMAKDVGARPATMDAFAEMMQGVMQAAGLRPQASGPEQIPQVSGGYQQVQTPPASVGYQQLQTPPAHSVFQPPAVPAVTPAPIAPTMPVAAAPARGGNAALFAIIGLVVLGGGGAAAYFALRTPDRPVAPAPGPTPAPGSDDTPAHHDDWPAAIDAGTAPTPPPIDDPWASKAEATEPGARPAPARAEHRGSVGTALTPIPSGARLELPESFEPVKNGRDGIAYLDSSRQVAVMMAPLYAGTNDPDKLAAMYVKETGFARTGRQKVTSAGAQRDGFGFVGKVAGAPAVQIAALYITPQYRLAVIVQAPGALFSDPAFQQEILEIFANDVVMP